jgi:hypothetical protein
LEAGKAASLVAGRRLLTCAEEPCDAPRPDSPTYIPVSCDWVPPEDSLPHAPLAGSFEYEEEKAPTDGDSSAEPGVGPIDTLLSKLQALPIPGEADQASNQDGLVQEKSFEDSTDVACFLDSLFPLAAPPALRAPSSWSSHDRNRSTSVEPSRRSLR